MTPPPDYLNPGIPAGLPTRTMKVLRADDHNLKGYGCLVDTPDHLIEISRWPAQGWRHVDTDSGNHGGTKQGTFFSEWRGDILYGKNEAVGGHYILGYAVDPTEAREDHSRPAQKLMMWHANYHPDGGQLFFPLEPKPFFVPLALPGDDVRPEDFICFVFDGTRGLYIHANVWHEGVFAIAGSHRFFDKQGAVHARVSVDFPREFGCLLEADLTAIASI